MSPLRLRIMGLKNDLKQFKRIGRLPFERVTVPTLKIHGTDDLDVPLVHAQNSSSSIPDAELFIEEGGVHTFSLSDAADEINEKRIMFFKNNLSSIEN